MGKIVKFLGWGQSNILGNNKDRSPQKLKFWGGDGDSIFGEFGHPSLDLSKEVLLVSVVQRAVELPAIKVRGLKKLLLFGLALVC